MPMNLLTSAPSLSISFPKSVKAKGYFLRGKNRSKAHLGTCARERKSEGVVPKRTKNLRRRRQNMFYTEALTVVGVVAPLDLF